MHAQLLVTGILSPVMITGDSPWHTAHSLEGGH